MKNNYRYLLKKILCLLLLSVVIITAACGCGGVLQLFKSGLKPSRFMQITIADKDGNASAYTDENKIGFYVEAINSAQAADDALMPESSAEYRITLEGKKPRHSREFMLYLDKNLENRALFIKKGRDEASF